MFIRSSSQSLHLQWETVGTLHGVVVVPPTLAANEWIDDDGMGGWTGADKR